MSNFYKIFINSIKKNEIHLGFEKQNKKIKQYGLEMEELEIITQYQKNAIQNHSFFLDSIDEANKYKIADTFISLLSEYNSIRQHYESISSLINDKKEKEEYVAINYSKKLNSDIRIAKNFRKTIETYREKYGDFMADLRDKNPHLPDDTNYNEMHPYFLMTKLLDDYILDLETKTFNIADKRKYSAYPEKDSKDNLRDYLHGVVKSFNIKGGVRNVNTLMANLNEAI